MQPNLPAITKHYEKRPFSSDETIKVFKDNQLVDKNVTNRTLKGIWKDTHICRIKNRFNEVRRENSFSLPSTELGSIISDDIAIDDSLPNSVPLPRQRLCVLPIISKKRYVNHETQANNCKDLVTPNVYRPFNMNEM